ncbi:DNA-binding PadR family transcriptional regulator [Dyella sp. SG562]|uniref:PadR family transcriptional regulator n=1 Tax=unclassified Dyella TaxID=2634549 RepID=UPI0017A18F04|nr:MULTISPECIES: PadR family transcriptional regulator [unclassified Dyella]NII72841.1 DNA-binding PadR family transcriptional regulator [Dyella sp. SG562]NKJ19539.1 DNA-binding PadR family transcriptional regulator [Dyella sp. SG609]
MRSPRHFFHALRQYHHLHHHYMRERFHPFQADDMDWEGGERHERYEHHFGRGHHFGDRMGGDFFAEWAGLRGGGRRGGGGRMFGHGDLKLLLLALIEQQPRHGYELIRLIEEMFHGHYSPSPGAIYPTLTMLEELGHAQVENEQGGRKLYAITDAGRAFLDENRSAVQAVMSRTEESARMAARMSLPMSIRNAMHALKHALLMRGASDWSKAETQRVASILEKAAADIAAGSRRE